MIRADGWSPWSIWEHSQTVRDLYERRCRLEVEEMTCAAQAAGLLAPLVNRGDTLLDAGCGSGYLFHSLKQRGIPVEYWGVDAAAPLIEIGRSTLPEHGLDPDRLLVARLEDLNGEVDHVVCMNVLSNLDNYHRPLERFLSMARSTVILRESLWDKPSRYTYVRDEYLDEGCDLRVHVNTYNLPELTGFIESYGFAVRVVTDERSAGEPELVIGHPHYWTFVVATRISAGGKSRP